MINDAPPFFPAKDADAIIEQHDEFFSTVFEPYLYLQNTNIAL